MITLMNLLGTDNTNVRNIYMYIYKYFSIIDVSVKAKVDCNYIDHCHMSCIQVIAAIDVNNY